MERQNNKDREKLSYMGNLGRSSVEAQYVPCETRLDQEVKRQPAVPEGQIEAHH